MDNPIVEYRRSKKITQRAASRAARVERNALRRAEAGAKVTWPIITALAAWMQADPHELEGQLAAWREHKEPAQPLAQQAGSRKKEKEKVCMHELHTHHSTIERSCQYAHQNRRRHTSYDERRHQPQFKLWKR